MNKTHWIILGLILIVLGIWGITAGDSEPTSGEPIRIGGAFGLTGFASIWGEADRNGALLAVEEINEKGGIDGRQVELLIEDTQSDNTKTLSAILKLVDVDSADFVLGPTWLDTFLSPAPLADKNNFIIIAPSAAITAVKSETNYQNIFSTWYRSDVQLQKLPGHLVKQDVSTVVAIYSNDVFWGDAIVNLREGSDKIGLDIIDEHKVNPDTTDLRTSITKTRESDPDIVFFGFSSEQNLSAFLKQRKEIYPDSILYTTESIEEFVNKEEFVDLLIGVRFVSPKVLENDFNNDYRGKFGVEPIFSASNSYDAVNIILRAIKEVGTNTDLIRNFVLDNEFKTVTFGNVRFDELGGVVGGEFVVKEITKEGLKTISEAI